MRLNRLSLWAMIACSRACVAFPYRWQMRAGRAIGRLAHGLMEGRRRVAETNLRLCFPERPEAERAALVRRTFESAGQVLFEVMSCWLMSPRRFGRIRFEYKGLEHLDAAAASGRGVLACGAHFACFEVVARHFGSLRPMSGVVYQQRDPVFDAYRRAKVATYVRRTVLHHDFRGMIEALRAGEVLWYLPDQDFGVGKRVRSSFFGVPIEALSAPVRLARTSGALILPCFFHRLPDDAGYAVHIHPAYEPAGDTASAVRRWYALLEQHVLAQPGQYVWTHRMFKTRPPGEPPVYG